MRGRAPTDTTLATSSSYRTRFSPPTPTESHGHILPATGAPGARRSSGSGRERPSGAGRCSRRSTLQKPGVRGEQMNIEEGLAALVGATITGAALYGGDGVEGDGGRVGVYSLQVR